MLEIYYSVQKKQEQSRCSEIGYLIVEDNGDYYCVRPDDKVTYGSNNGSTDETWDNIATWIQDVWIGGN